MSGISLPSDISLPRAATEPRIAAERQMTEPTETEQMIPTAKAWPLSRNTSRMSSGVQTPLHQRARR